MLLYFKMSFWFKCSNPSPFWKHNAEPSFITAISSYNRIWYNRKIPQRKPWKRVSLNTWGDFETSFQGLSASWRHQRKVSKLPLVSEVTSIHGTEIKQRKLSEFMLLSSKLDKQKISDSGPKIWTRSWNESFQISSTEKQWRRRRVILGGNEVSTHFSIMTRELKWI